MRRLRRRSAPSSASIAANKLLYGARRRFAERLVEVNRLCKLLADEI
jgi:hypothetical protein